MVRMPNFAEDIERELGDLLHRRPGQSQAPAPSPVSIKAAPAARPTEELMSLATDLHNAADRLDKIGEDAVTKLETVVASPVGTTALTLVHDVVGLNIDPRIVESALGGLQALLQAYGGPADAAPAAPADPAQQPVPAPAA